MNKTLTFSAGLILSLSTLPSVNGQTPAIEQSSTRSSRSEANMITRTVEAVNYQHRSGATKIDFGGTDMMPSASGQAKVESKKGYLEIEAEFHNLKTPTTFGTE